MIEPRRIWERHPLTSAYLGFVLVAVLFQVAMGWWLM